MTATYGFRYLHEPLVRLTAIVISLLAFSTELGSFSLSIDEEAFAYDAHPWRTWMAQGRWSMAFLAWLLPPISAVPFLSTFLFCAALSVSALLLAGCFAPSRREAVAFVALFASFPVWPHVVEFNQLAAGYGLGLVLVSLAIGLVWRRNLCTAFVAGLAASIATGIHQSLLVVFLCGSLFAAARQFGGTSEAGIDKSSRPSGMLGWLAASWGVAVLGYFAIARFALFATGESLTYVDQFVRLREYLTPWSARQALVRVFTRVAELTAGVDPMFLGWGGAVLALSWLGGLYGLWRLIERSRSISVAGILPLVLTVAATASAFATVFGATGGAPARSLGALSLVYAIAGAAAMRLEVLRQFPQWALLSYAVLVNCWISTALFNADAVARQRDAVQVAVIAQRLADFQLRADRPMPFTTVGMWSHDVGGPALRVEVFGASYFEHDGGNVYRILYYLRLLGIQGLHPVPPSQLKGHLSVLEQMASWPDPGSLAVVDGTVVLKLGPLPRDQQRSLEE